MMLNSSRSLSSDCVPEKGYDIEVKPKITTMESDTMHNAPGNVEVHLWSSESLRPDSWVVPSRTLSFPL